MADMRTPFLAVLALAFLSLAVTEPSSAQRRTEGSSGGSSDRGTPSSGGSSARGGGGSDRGGSRPAAGGGERSGGTRATPSRAGGREDVNTSTRSTGRGGRSTATSRERPASGKIGSVRRGAEAARDGKNLRPTVWVGGGPVWVGGCWSCDYWGWYGGRWGRYHGGWWYPDYHDHVRERDDEDDEEREREEGGQGYLDYPYARSTNPEDTFVRRRTVDNRGFGAITAYGFSDMGSTTRAGRLALEGALGRVRGSIEYGRYDEPLQTRTDRMHTLRFNVGLQPRLGERAYLVAAIGARGLFVDSLDAWGPEGELGIQVFPMRPLGMNITGRIAGMSWEGYDDFTIRELNTTGSVFLGRIELQGGWHWMKIGDAPAFGGPMAGVRLWF